jgi:hypothetical protein
MLIGRPWLDDDQGWKMSLDEWQVENKSLRSKQAGWVSRKRNKI